MADQSAGGADIESLEEFLPYQPEKPEAPSRKDFKPWHKPRKQFIRKLQWWREIDKLIQTTHFPVDSRNFRYLTLPSEDMLDVRILGDSLRKRNLKLKYLGFYCTKSGSPGDIRMNLSENDVKALEEVENSSETVRERLESMADESSIGFSKLAEHAPFHAVNIDLCNHFASPSAKPPIIEALSSIAKVQSDKSSGSWLLFLTTRLDNNHFDPSHLDAFIQAIVSNINQSEEFSADLGSFFQAETSKLQDWLGTVTSQPLHTFRDFFCIGLGKWLLRFLGNAYPSIQVEMLPSYFYTVHSGPDMLSLAYRCTPLKAPPRDSFNLVKGSQEPPVTPVVNEPESARDLIRFTRELADADLQLSGDNTLNEEMIVESEFYLELASYDVSSYREFATRAISGGSEIVSPN